MVFALKPESEYKIKCMAYTGGGVNNNDRVAEIIKKRPELNVQGLRRQRILLTYRKIYIEDR